MHVYICPELHPAVKHRQGGVVAKVLELKLREVEAVRTEDGTVIVPEEGRLDSIVERYGGQPVRIALVDMEALNSQTSHDLDFPTQP